MFAPSRPALLRATEMASGETLTATIVARGHSRASEMAMMPEPVPRSRILGLARPGQPFQCEIDQYFGFRAWDQDGGRHLKDAAAKLRLADQIGKRFAGRPALDPFRKLRIGRRDDWRFRARQQIRVRAAGGVLQQQAGVEPVDFLPCCGQRLEKGHFQFCSASSASSSA